jgi:hypothetical protein
LRDPDGFKFTIASGMPSAQHCDRAGVRHDRAAIRRM